MSSLLQGSFAIGIYNFNEHTNRSHPNAVMFLSQSLPPKKLVRGGFPTPHTLFCLICTINSELTYFPICTTIE